MGITSFSKSLQMKSGMENLIGVDLFAFKGNIDCFPDTLSSVNYFVNNL